MKLQLSSFCLVAGVFASPVQLTTGQCTTKIDKFDDLTGNPVPLTQNDIGAYNGLVYGRFATLSASGLQGVAAESPNNTAGVGLTRTLTSTVLDLLNGAGGTTSVTLFPFGTISAPAGKYFDLLEFYFGCRLNGVAAVILPAVRCDFTATGFNYLDQPVSEESFTYAPVTGSGPLGPILNADMSFKQFDKFRKMKNVTITLASSSTLTAAVIMIDNVKHCNY